MMITEEELSALDELSVSTCSERKLSPLVLLNDACPFNSDVRGSAANDSETVFIRCSIKTEDGGLITGCKKDDSLVFPLESVDFILAPASDEDRVVLKVIASARKENVEWYLVVQMRIQVLPEGNESEMFKIVDADIFEFGNRAEPLVIHINDHSIARIRLSIRTVCSTFNPLPDFRTGDTLVKFFDSEGRKLVGQLRTYRALLEMHSSILAGAIQKSTGNEGSFVLEIKNCDEHSFRELLYQVYPTHRPIYANIRALSKAAVRFKACFVLDALIDYLVNCKHLGFQAKINEAVELDLGEAVRELVYNAAKSGNWNLMISKGFDPKHSFSHETYSELVCPALEEASNATTSDPYRRKLISNRDFTDWTLASSTSTVQLKAHGRIFLVSRGILKVHNDSQFGRGNEGEYYINTTLELQDELSKSNVELGDMIQQLVLLLHRRAHVPQAKFIRPLIIFASVHQMPHLKQRLENMLLMEPPLSSMCILDHLQWAEKYNLANLERTTLFRIEGGYRELALGLIQLPQFEKLLSKDSREKVLDRLCSGWGAFGDDRLTKSRPTHLRVRHVTCSAGGMVLQADEDELETLLEANSDAVYKDQHELAIIP